MDWPLYVIHYTRAPERKRAMQVQFFYEGIDSCTFVEPFDREALTDDLLARAYAGTEENWNERAVALHDIYREQAYHNRLRKTWSEGVDYDVDLPWTRLRPLRLAEISCSMKHWLAWRDIQRNATPIAVVLEDDVILVPDFVDRLHDGLARTPAGWDIICFGYGSHMRVPERTPDQTVYRMRPGRMKCTDSYFITGRAALLLVEALLPFSQPLDWEMTYWMNKFDLNVYWWDPPITLQGSQNGSYQSLVQGGPE